MECFALDLPLCGTSVYCTFRSLNFRKDIVWIQKKGLFPSKESFRVYSRLPPYSQRLKAYASRDDCLIPENGSKRGDALKETIFELEYMMKDPHEVLGRMQGKLSSQDLQVVLNYFAQEGRDSWFALEVYDWMQKVNKVEDDTHELMMTIMFNWIMKLLKQDSSVEKVISLLEEMYFVGLKPEPEVMQSIILVYWEQDKQEDASLFLKQLLSSKVEVQMSDLVAFFILKMVKDGQSKRALDLMVYLKESGFKFGESAYNAAMLAAVAEQSKFTRMIRMLLSLQQNGTIANLVDKDFKVIEAYESSLHDYAEEIGKWAEAEVPDSVSFIYERLLAMYCIAGKGLEAERSLWRLKLSGREPIPEMYNTIIGICGYRNQAQAAYQLLGRMEGFGLPASKKTFSVLLGGLVKGGNVEDAAVAMQHMLDRGFYPDTHEMLVVLRALQNAGLSALYLKLCKCLTQKGLIEPCLMYFYFDAYKLCIIRMA